MLSILPDHLDEDLSSDSSESLTSSPKRKCASQSLERYDNLVEERAEKAGSRKSPSGACSAFTPEVSAENPPNSPVDKSDAILLKTTITADKLKKFHELQDKRVCAAQEKVEEGYRRKRRRRKRRRDFGGYHSVPPVGGPLNKPQHSDGSVNNPAMGEGSEIKQRSSQSQQEHWDTLKGYLNVNAHISQGVDHGQFAPKSGLEKRLDKAVAEGDFEAAEDISDQLAKRELGCKIAKAADARDYIKWKTEQEEEKAVKRRRKKKKLAWGFEAKNRWEMKANM
ncbi:uncharacterized protein [Diadema antillarum]|uniref:uncharacterized protein n=1 Tax=Diadema antillarum TaxID=105358 RepID=UPI003A86047B